MIWLFVGPIEVYLLDFLNIFMFFFCLVFAMPLCASVYLCFVVTCWERAGLLALVLAYNCSFSLSPSVSLVSCCI